MENRSRADSPVYGSNPDYTHLTVKEMDFGLSDKRLDQNREEIIALL